MAHWAAKHVYKHVMLLFYQKINNSPGGRAGAPSGAAHKAAGHQPLFIA